MSSTMRIRASSSVRLIVPVVGLSGSVKGSAGSGHFWMAARISSDCFWTAARTSSACFSTWAASVSMNAFVSTSSVKRTFR